MMRRRTIVVPDRKARWWSERLPNAGRGGPVGVPLLPRAREALKPGVEPVVIALSRQSARSVAQPGDPLTAEIWQR
jgi:hypothetical protein